jgi:hypothetical protein
MIEANSAIKHTLIIHHDALESWRNTAKRDFAQLVSKLGAAEWAFPVL